MPWPRNSPHPFVVANVVAMRSTAVGDYVYRVSQPALAMGRLPGVRVLTINVTSPYLTDVCLGADVLVLHLLTEEDLIPLVAERQRRGLPTIYEVSDNFMAVHDEVGIRGWFGDATNRANAFHLIGMADAVQVTGQGLYDRFGHLNPRTVIVDNQIASVGAGPRAAGPLVRVGWAGSSGHRDDLRHINPAVTEVSRRHPEAAFAFMGDRRLYDDLLAGVPEGRKTFRPAGSLQDYLTFLETLDIGIAPLLPTPYNQCRSDVKFLEYASRGVAPLLSRETPYLAHARHGQNALLFGDNAELVALLSRLVSDEGERLALAARAHLYVARERTEDGHAAARLRFYERLAAHAGAAAGAGAGAGDLAVPAVHLDPSSESYDVAQVPEERLIVDGIRAAAAADLPGARVLFRRAAEARPNYALPLFWWGRTHELAHQPADAAALYARTLAVEPRSVRARLHLARVLHASGDLVSALETLQIALDHCGDHAPSLATAGALCEALEQRDDAATLYRRALDACPDYDPASAGLSRVAPGPV